MIWRANIAFDDKLRTSQASRCVMALHKLYVIGLWHFQIELGRVEIQIIIPNLVTCCYCCCCNLWMLLKSAQLEKERERYETWGLELLLSWICLNILIRCLAFKIVRRSILSIDFQQWMLLLPHYSLAFICICICVQIQYPEYLKWLSMCCKIQF